MRKFMSLTTLSKRFGRPDTERLGIFIEMPYLPADANPKSKKEKKVQKDEGTEPYSTRGMYPGGPKSKCGNQDGYFDDTFKRIFSGEGPGKTKRIKKKKEALAPFIPAGSGDKPTGSGDYHGTFAGMWESFSPVTKKKPKRKPERPNPITNPGKKGGPGYVNICIEKYPEHSEGMARKPKKPKKFRAGPMVTAHYTRSYFLKNVYKDPKEEEPTKKWYIKKEERVAISKAMSGRPIFAPTGPGKWMGGAKEGTFSKFPAWKKEPYLSYLQMKAALAGRKVPFIRGEFYPQVYGFKTMLTFPTIHTTSYLVNCSNWKTYEPTYVKRLVKSIF